MASQPQPLSEPPSPLGTPATIPLELRRMIYGLVLASSSSLIGTSTAIKDETLPMLYDHGIQRTRINLDRDIASDFGYSCFDPWQKQKPYYLVDHSIRRLDEDNQALVKKLSITIDMMQPHSLSSFRKPKVCTLRFPSTFHTL